MPHGAVWCRNKEATNDKYKEITKIKTPKRDTHRTRKNQWRLEATVKCKVRIFTLGGLRLHHLPRPGHQGPHSAWVLLCGDSAQLFLFFTLGARCAGGDPNYIICLLVVYLQKASIFCGWSFFTGLFYDSWGKSSWFMGMKSTMHK